jgi:hypothetical protein
MYLVGESIMLTQYPMHRYALVLCALLAASCGGGGSSSSPSTPPVSNNPPPPIDVTLTGKVMNGYLQGASVCLDANDNLRCDSGEITAVTNATGDYSLTVPAAQTASLTSTRLIAYVQATAIDADTKLAVGYDSILLTKPYTAGMTTYIFTPLTTAVEIGVFAGLPRAEALAEALKRYGFSKLSLYDDYVAARTGTNATEATVITAYANTEFRSEHRAAIDAIKSPSPDRANALASTGIFRETIASTTVGGVSTLVPTGIYFGFHGAPDSNGSKELNWSAWTYDAAAGYQLRSILTNTVANPIFDSTGWLPIAAQINGGYRLAGNRSIYSYGGKDLISVAEASEDLSGKPIGSPYVLGYTPSANTPAFYKQGAKGFPVLTSVALQEFWTADDAEPYYDQYGFPSGTVANFTALTSGVNPNGFESWRPIASYYDYEIRFFNGQVFFRLNQFGGPPAVPIASGPYSFVTVGKITLLKAPFPAALNFSVNGLDPDPIYFAEYQNTVRQVHLTARGSVSSNEFTYPSRSVNRSTMESIVGALGWSPMPATLWSQ